MLIGTGSAEEFESEAPRMDSLSTEGVDLPNAIFLQALFEIDSADMCAMLPPALHPTLPPVASLSVFDVPESPWGQFRLAQLRIQCRSGLRPRGFLVSAVVDGDRARRGLAAGFGFRGRSGAVSLERGYDAVRLEVDVGGRGLKGVMRAPMRIGESDVQFVSSLHPASTPRGFRLVQVDTRFDVQRAERARLTLEGFDGEAWGEGRVIPTALLPGVVGVADLSLDPIRFVCRPDVLAFEGTESVGSSD